MGRRGSGGHNKTHGTVESFRRLDSFDYRRYMELFQYGEMHEIFGSHMYKGGDIVYDALYDKTDIRYGKHYVPLRLYWVEGVDGSKSRLYFCCPHCRRRVRYLYNYNGFFVCRHCLNANYKSQQATKDSINEIRRQMRKIVEEDLGYTWWRKDHHGETIAELESIPKPRYMRWEKYEQLMAKYRYLQDKYVRCWYKEMWAFIPEDMRTQISLML